MIVFCNMYSMQDCRYVPASGKIHQLDCQLDCNGRSLGIKDNKRFLGYPIHVLSFDI